MAKYRTLIILIPLLLWSAGCSQDPGKTNPLNFLLIPDTSDTGYVPGAGYSLVWSDEFNGAGINTADWSYETEATGWSQSWNGEWQNYTENGTAGGNAYVMNGALVIQANYNGMGHAEDSYTSARLVTKGKKSWTHGKVAARMALPFGKGIWPALWLLGENGTWPASGEIDIMEMIGGGTGDNEIHGTIHWDDNGHKQFGKTKTILTPREFHIYTMEWDANSMSMGVDGINYFTKDISSAEFSEFHQNFYLLINLAVGGTWGGYPDETTPFPQFFIIDWIRVYQ